jgi:hypothetical protein
VALAALQPTHEAPPVPQAAVLLPGWQEVPEQHPLGHEVAVHLHTPLTHCCPAPHAALTPQRQPPLVQVSATSELHVTQEPPFGPQLPVVVPALQVPPPQQPLHGVWLPAPQLVVQVCVAVLQLFPTGQSLATLQPQLVPLMQRWPLPFAEQSTQAVPAAPHVVSPVPALQLPEPQHPPLQSCVGLHALVHALPETWHDCRPLQSELAAQPQLPPVASATQMWPADDEEHGVQRPPESPHKAAFLPL